MTINSRAQKSKDRIIDAAEIAFRDVGFEGAQLEVIATHAGVTRKTIYNLFGSKEGLAEACVANAGAQAINIYGPSIQAGDSVLTLLQTIFTDSANWCLANPDLAKRALIPRVRPSMEKSTEPSFQSVVTDVVRLGQRQGVIRSDQEPEFLALVLLGLFGQLMLSAISVGGIPEGEIARIIRIAVEGIGA